MSVSTREMLLIIRASDQASRIISGVGNSFSSLEGKQKAAAMASIQQGQALVSIGAAIAAVGIAGVAFYASTAKAASAYNKEAALTLTQVDQTGVSLKTIKQIGIDVAKAIPAPFEQMQKTLYDIFSSMDVGPREAKILLTEFAKAAVAGNVDVQTAGRATIAILNGFKLPVSEVSRVMDVQFQLVRKGVGTYQEFATSIGRVIPSAVRAGQSVETMAGMLAFLTRNGLSAAMAATSAARAMDAISNPITVGRLEGIGIKVKDIHGEFLPLVDILGQMNTKFKDLTGPERAKALQDLFKGSGGTIQARRFFDPVFKNFDEFSKRVGEMKNSTGSLGKAYEIMASQSAAKAQAFSNAWHILKVEIGDKFLPIGAKLIEFMTHLINIFDSIPGPVKTIIVVFGALLSVVMAVSGVVIALVGAFMIMQGTLALMGIELSAILIPAGLIVAAILAIVVVGYLLITHWKTLKKWAGDVWGFIKDVASAAWQGIQRGWDNLMGYLMPAWQGLAAAAVTTWNAITSVFRAAWGIIEGIGKSIADFFGPQLSQVWGTLKTAWSQLWNDLGKDFELVGKHISDIWSLVVDYLQIGWSELQVAFNIGIILIKGYFDLLLIEFHLLADVAAMVWGAISSTFSSALGLITALIKVTVDIITAVWRAFGDNLIAYVKIMWEFITAIIQAAINAVFGIIRLFLDLVTGNWSGAWDAIKQIVSGVWEAIAAVIRLGIQMIQQAIDIGLSAIRLAWDIAWSVIKNIIPAALEFIVRAVAAGLVLVVDFFTKIPGRIISAIGDAGKMLWHVGEQIVDGLVQGLKNSWHKVTDFISNAASHLPGFVKGPLKINSPSKVFMAIGSNIFDGLNQGLLSQYPALQQVVKDAVDLLQVKYGSTKGTLNAIANVATGASSSVAGATGTGGVNITFADGSFAVTIEGQTGLTVNDVQQAISARNEQLIRQIKQALGS